MAALNIVNVATINGNTTYYTPSGTTAVVLLSNAASSSHLYKVDQIIATNTTSSAVNCTVAVYSAAGTQGSAPAGGTAYPIASTISVPPNSSLVVSDKTTTFYLMENQSISVTSGTANALTFVTSYEDMS